MRLFEFVPIYDHTIDDDSLIERAFGPEFCVVDETGHLLTTAHNQNLLRRAKTLIEHSADIERQFLTESLLELRNKAEVVTQHDYELAVARSNRDVEWESAEFDYSLRAGGLL